MNDNLQVIPPQQPGPISGYDTAIPVESYNVPPSGFRLDKFLTALRRLWWVPLLTIILAAGTGVGIILIIPPTYVSRAALWETEKFHLPGGALFSDDGQNGLGTHIEMLKSSKMAELAYARLKTQGTNAIPLDKDGKPLKLKIDVASSPKSSVIVLDVTSPNAQYSQSYLDALIEEFLDYRKNVRKSVAGETLSSISDQVLRLERDLKADQDALTAFERTNNLTVLQEESTAMGSYLTKLKLQISDLKLEAELLEASVMDQETARKSNTVALASLESGNSSALTAMKDLQLLKMERDRLAKKLRPKHPKLIKLDNDIDRSQKMIDVFRAQSLEQLTNSRQSLQKKIASVEASIKEWEPKVGEATSRIAEADHLKLGISRAQSLYDRFVGLLQNVDISRNIDQETLSILENASPAARTYKKEQMAGAISMIGGLGLGMGIVLLVGFRDDKLTSSTDIFQQLNTPIVGQLPELLKAKDEKTLALIAPNDQRHIYAESYRNLRSALLFQFSEGERPKIILITSSVPSEGKSTVAANLATTMALGGSRVLLIDADLRKGKLHTLLQAQADPGLAELLSKKAVADRVIQSTNLPNLSFMGRGAQGLNPSDLFLSDAMPELLKHLRSKFDHIIIDTCPIFAADDATTLAPLVDGTLFVVRGKNTQAGMAREALELLHQRQTRILGIVFNGVDATSRSNYYYRYPQYYR